MSSPSTYRVPAYRLYLARDSSVRVSERPAANAPATIAALARAFIQDDGREHAVVVLLDHKMRAAGIYEVSVGTVDRAPVFVREVVKAAILADAAGVAFIHNHPGGTLVPSEDDKTLQRAIQYGMDAVGCKLVDFIIITHDSASYYSASECRKL